MPGLIEAGPDVPVATAIEDLLLVAECSARGSPEVNAADRGTQP
jgi:hypothetical protein